MYIDKISFSNNYIYLYWEKKYYYKYATFFKIKTNLIFQLLLILLNLGVGYAKLLIQYIFLTRFSLAKCNKYLSKVFSKNHLLNLCNEFKKVIL